MFVRITSDQRSRLKSVNRLGVRSLTEFTYRRGVEIFGEGEAAEYVYQIQTGAVRSYKLLSDGRRQIGAFHLAGDIFGLENGPVHRFTAEALEETTACLIRRQILEDMVSNDVFVASNLLDMTSSSLEHAENHLLLLGRKSALERVAAFMVEMDKRLTATGVMTLPMSRRDIADYLGLTLETVSRAISRLTHEGVLEFSGQTKREFIIRDRLRLSRFDPFASLDPPSAVCEVVAA